MGYNTLFEIDLRDMELIETALRDQMGKDVDMDQEIQQLLGRIHNQKNWYRPSDSKYISG